MIIKADYQAYMDAVGLYFLPHEGSIVEPIQMTVSKKADGEWCPASMELKHDQAQQLMNELWRCGLRPKNGEGTSAQVDALKYHLEDMRSLVFKK